MKKLSMPMLLDYYIHIYFEVLIFTSSNSKIARSISPIKIRYFSTKDEHKIYFITK